MDYFAWPSYECYGNLTILDYYELYTVTSPKKDALPRTVASPGKYLDCHNNTVSKRRDNSSHVCRIVFQSAAVRVLIYLRLLIHRIPGHPFEDMRTVPCPSNVEFIRPTFHDAARARSLITCDEEYICMGEADYALFVTLILDGAPAPKLWSEFHENLIENLKLSLTTDEAI